MQRESVGGEFSQHQPGPCTDGRCGAAQNSCVGALLPWEGGSQTLVRRPWFNIKLLRWSLGWQRILVSEFDSELAAERREEQPLPNGSVPGSTPARAPQSQACGFCSGAVARLSENEGPTGVHHLSADCSWRGQRTRARESSGRKSLRKCWSCYFFPLYFTVSFFLASHPSLFFLSTLVDADSRITHSNMRKRMRARTHMHASAHIHARKHTHARERTHTSTNEHTHARERTRARAQTRTWAHTHAREQTHIHARKRTHTHIHTHTRTRPLIFCRGQEGSELGSKD